MKRLPPIILSRTAKTSAKLFLCHKAFPTKSGNRFWVWTRGKKNPELDEDSPKCSMHSGGGGSRGAEPLNFEPCLGGYSGVVLGTQRPSKTELVTIRVGQVKEPFAPVGI